MTRDLAGQPTLPAKHQSTVTKMAARHKAKIKTPHGLRTCFEARDGATASRTWWPGSAGFPCTNRGRRSHRPGPARARPPQGTAHRLLTRRCELCGTGPRWSFTRSASSPASGRPDQASPRGRSQMAQIRRKTLVVCDLCHDAIHAHPVTKAA